MLSYSDRMHISAQYSDFRLRHGNEHYSKYAIHYRKAAGSFGYGLTGEPLSFSIGHKYLFGIEITNRTIK